MTGKRATSCPAEILLVEDNPGDIRLIQEAFGQATLACSLNVVGNGLEAISFLRQEGKYSGSHRPDLIILDLNLPKKDGRELLAEVKEDDDLKRIPVVILTSSEEEKDILKAYNLHANSYMIKPGNFNQLARMVKSIEEFWFTTAILPPE